MKIDFIIKIIKAIFKIGSYIKVKKKNMPDDNTTDKKSMKTTVLGANTVVQFTFKGFITTLLTILGIFFGFYKLVIQPDIQDTKEYQKEMYDRQEKYMEQEFGEVKNAIQINTQAIQATNDRFRDLNNSFEEISNTGGSLGSPSSTNISSNGNGITDDDSLADTQD